MSGKVAFVTGAAMGIGRASVLAFGAEGAKVMAADRDAERLQETAAIAQEAGVHVSTIILDVTDREAVFGAVEATIKRFGAIDYAHNNAGIIAPGTPFAETPIETFEKVLNVNLFGVIHCMQAQIKAMLKQKGGCIVNTASVNSHVALQGIAPYVTSKHAVLGLTKTAALEYAAHGIRINAVCPGMVETPMTDQFLNDPQIREALLAKIPCGRPSQPEEVAQAAIYLCSPDAGYAIGTALVLDGGFTLG